MTREEMLSVAKPILFNTEMVCKVLDGTKTATRRVVKQQPGIECSHGGQHEFIRDDFIEGSDFTGFVCKKCGHGVCGPHFKFPVGTSFIRPPYRTGDILYVRETWNCLLIPEPLRGTSKTYWYKADGATPEDKWRPSIHMPKEAARIFLRVTGAKVCRLQDITEEQAKAEGAVKAYPYIDPSTHETEYMESEYGDYLAGFECLWNSCYAAPRGVKDGHGVITNYESFPFEEIRETRTYKGKPWYVIGNPWVWGYEFEMVEAEE